MFMKQCGTYIVEMGIFSTHLFSQTYIRLAISNYFQVPNTISEVLFIYQTVETAESQPQVLVMILTSSWMVLSFVLPLPCSGYRLNCVGPFCFLIFCQRRSHETHDIMAAYFPLLHVQLSTESLFNAFATAAFFKFVVFSIFEMRYLLAIWKANRPLNSGEGWEIMRRELSVLYSRFCKYKPSI
jgi:hypothetical protein